MEEVPPYSDKKKPEINLKKAYSDNWREALQEVYDADPFFQQTILCRLYDHNLLPQEIHDLLERINYSKHHYVINLPKSKVDPADIAALRKFDLCSDFNDYLSCLEKQSARQRERD